MKRQYTRFRLWNQVSIQFAKQIKYSSVRYVEDKILNSLITMQLTEKLEDILREQLKRDLR